MPSFPKPTFAPTVNVAQEKNNLITYRNTKPGRAIPNKSANRLLLATWNIANLGAQERDTQHHQLIAEIISWFDVIAIQEVKDDLSGLRAIQGFLPGYRTVFTDKGGNDERMAFLYDSAKITTLEKFGELAIPPADYGDINLPGVTSKFNGFDRSPFIASFHVGSMDILLLNVHSYFGSDSNKKSIERRSLEAYAISRWADLRRQSKFNYTPNILALGDFNLPKKVDTDPIYKALRAPGLELPDHSTKIYSNITNDADYDQICFLPGIKNKLTGSSGVFDYDGAIFPAIFNNHTPGEFRAYLRYYISDHRPLWLELDVT